MKIVMKGYITELEEEGGIYFKATETLFSESAFDLESSEISFVKLTIEELTE